MTTNGGVMALDLDAIEAEAKAATPGEWAAGWTGDGHTVEVSDAVVAHVGDHEQAFADAAHIARMSPATTLALVAELRAAREEIREHAKADLLTYMRDLSEHCYCAGWLHWIEYDLWGFLTNGPGDYGQGDITQGVIDRLRALSERCGGWWTWVDGDDEERFVTSQEWAAMLPIHGAEMARALEREGR